MSYRFRLSAVVVLLKKTPAAKFRVKSSPTPIRPEGKLDAIRTLVEEIRVPPKLAAGLKVVLKSAWSGPFCQIALFARSNSRLRPTVSAKLVVINQRDTKLVMN